MVALAAVAGIVCLGTTTARADTLTAPQTLIAYNINVDGGEYLQEGYVEKDEWQKDFNAEAEQVEQLYSELLDLRLYLSDEDMAIVDNFAIENFNYIEELKQTKDDFAAMKEEALAAKEKQLQEQKRKEEQRSQAATTQQSYSSNGSGLTRSSGVNYFNGRKETYYSSRVLYHYRTSEWTVDDEGFYRTAEGYYVVAASDMAQGTVFQGSKGMCQVLDSGCAAKTTDYYVNWD